MVVVVIYPKNVGGPPSAVNPSRARVQPLRAGAAGQSGKRIHNAARAARPVQPEINISVRTPAAATPFHSTRSSKNYAAPAKPWRRAKIVDQTERDRIGAAVCRSHIMKILAESVRRDIGERNVTQQRLRRAGNQRWIEHIGISVELIGLPGLRIGELDRVTVIVGGLAEVARALGLGRHR